jgi:hypothetical protein
VLAGAEVKAGRCSGSDGSFEEVYVNTGIGTASCFYRAGAFVGQVDWSDSNVNVNGCLIFRGPVVYGEFPDAVLKANPTSCSGLTTYRVMRSLDGGAGAPNAPSVGDCYQAATATCGTC